MVFEHPCVHSCLDCICPAAMNASQPADVCETGRTCLCVLQYHFLRVLIYVSVSAVAQVMRNTSHASRVSRSSSPLVSLRVGKILPHNSWKSHFIEIQLLHGNLVCPQQQLAPSPTNQRRQAAPVMSKPVMLPPSKTLRPDPHRSAHRPDGPV